MFFNQGTSIPKLLPTSTLACIPSLSYIKTFMPDAGKDGICNKPCTTTKLTDLPSGNNDKKLNRKSKIMIKKMMVVKLIKESKI